MDGAQQEIGGGALHQLFGSFWITETTIKDTWTISRGRVEIREGGVLGGVGVEGWGEKAYNCN